MVLPVGYKRRTGVQRNDRERYRFFPYLSGGFYFSAVKLFISAMISLIGVQSLTDTSARSFLPLST